MANGSGWAAGSNYGGCRPFGTGDILRLYWAFAVRKLNHMKWIGAHIGLALTVSFLLSLGLLAILKPCVWLRWVRRGSTASIAENERHALLIIRILGAIFLCFGLFLLDQGLSFG